MAVGEDETISIRPDRIIGIEAQKALPERIDHRRQRHRRARMPGIGLLDRIHRQCTNCVDALIVKRVLKAQRTSHRLRRRMEFNEAKARDFDPADTAISALKRADASNGLCVTFVSDVRSKLCMSPNEIQER